MRWLFFFLPLPLFSSTVIPYLNYMSPPNQLTLVRVILTPVFAFLLISDSTTNKQLALLVYVIAALTDWYDGWVARRWGFITRWGKFFDPLADKILTSTAFIMFAWIGYADAWMVWIIVVRDLLVTALRSYTEYKGKPVDTSKFAKTKTFVQLVVIYLFLIAYVVRNSPALYSIAGTIVNRIMIPEVTFSAMLIVTFLTAWTGILYAVRNWQTIKDLFSTHARTAESE